MTNHQRHRIEVNLDQLRHIHRNLQALRAEPGTDDAHDDLEQAERDTWNAIQDLERVLRREQ